jgi:transposase InsO family protein
MIKYQLLNSIEQSRMSSNKACRILGLNPDRFYRWRSLYRAVGAEGLSDKPPLAENVPNRLLPEEEHAIFGYAENFPKQHHREIKYNLEKQDIHVSSSSVYRRLKEKNLIKEHSILKPKKRWIKPEAIYPNQHWLIDITYILINKCFWYLIAVMDLYSRYVVGWELSATAAARDLNRVIDFALIEHNLHDKDTKPIIHSDNGSQMKAKSFKKFLKDLGVLNEYSRPHIPQDLAALERLFRTTKQEEVYHNDYTDHLEARDSLSGFFAYYNNDRPHQGIGNVAPYDRFTGRDAEIIKIRKIKTQVAQQRRILQNKINQTSKTTEVPVYTNNLNFLLERI